MEFDPDDPAEILEYVSEMESFYVFNEDADDFLYGGQIVEGYRDEEDFNEMVEEYGLTGHYGEFKCVTIQRGNILSKKMYTEIGDDQLVTVRAVTEDAPEVVCIPLFTKQTYMEYFSNRNPEDLEQIERYYDSNMEDVVEALEVLGLDDE